MIAPRGRTSCNKMDRTRLNYTEMKALLKCPRCLWSPMRVPIYVCVRGHNVCATCYEEICKEVIAGEALCVMCHQKITDTRNLLAETLARHIRNWYGNKSSMHILREGHHFQALYGDNHKPLFIVNSMEGLYSNTLEPGETSVSLDKGSKPSSSDLPTLRNPGFVSHRPIQCPKAPCASTVAVAALTAHFSFDHPDVPLLLVEPGIASHLWIAPESIPLEMSRCLVLLLLSGQKRKDSRCRLMSNLSRNMTQYTNRNPLPLMASRSRVIGDRSRLWKEDESDSCALDMDQDCILLWVSDVDSVLHYTIQVNDKSETCRPRSMTVTNAVASLRDSQAPMNIYRHGDAAVLYPSFVKNLVQTSGGFNITVTIN